MRLDEIFSSPVQYKWIDQSHGQARAVFMIGDIKYDVTITAGYVSDEGTEMSDDDEVAPVIAPGYDVYWDVVFSTILPGTTKHRLDNTGTGNQYAVYSTVLQIVKDHMQSAGVGPIYMHAGDDGRKSLYLRMMKRLLPTWNTTINDDGELISIPG